MPTWKPETPSGAVPTGPRDFDVTVRLEPDANGRPRYFCTVTPHGRGGPETFRLHEVACAENPKAKRTAFKAVLARLCEMWLASHVDGADPVAVPNDEEEVTP